MTEFKLSDKIENRIKKLKEEKLLFEEEGSVKEGFRIEYLRLQIKIIEEISEDIKEFIKRFETKMTEFKLSDGEYLDERGFPCFYKSTIKEFIKRLKEDLIMLMLDEKFTNIDVRKTVDKLSGDLDSIELEGGKDES